MCNTSESSGELALRLCQDIQYMIELTAEHLDRLRKPMPTSELTKQEMRTLEGKLIKHFSKQLAARIDLPSYEPTPFAILAYPSIVHWLAVVGTTADSTQMILSNIHSFDALRAKTNHELQLIISSVTTITEAQRVQDFRRLSKALHNLRKYTERKTETSPTVLELFWESWEIPPVPDTLPPVETPRSASLRTAASSEDFWSLSVSKSCKALMESPATSSRSSTSSSMPSPSPGYVSTLSPLTTSSWQPVTCTDGGDWCRATPPSPLNSAINVTPCQQLFQNFRAQSNESELGGKYSRESRESLQPVTKLAFENFKSALEVETEHVSSPISPSICLSICELPENVSQSVGVNVPISPRTPRGMCHAIKHRFGRTYKPTRCDLCQEYMFNGLKCKECKFKCHRDCESHVPPSCGLPEDLVNYYMNELSKEGSSPLLPRMPLPSALIVAFEHHTGGTLRFGGGNHQIPGYPDSSSNTSSCNSSTPNSPAILITSQATPPHSASSITTQSVRSSHFQFPPITQRQHQREIDPANIPETQTKPIPQMTLSAPPSNSVKPVGSHNLQLDTIKSYDSDKTLSCTSGSSGSVGTAYRLDSQDSTASVEDSTLNSQHRQTSISLREWDIPFEELRIGDKIGTGRFSTVHKGNWHGDVAIKFLNMENINDEATLEAFRSDVSTFRKTRHENLILFMGACVSPPRLAIITSLCKGNTLFNILHLRKDNLAMNKLVLIGQQICQGMGYLHHRGIVHKDLKTKNIFYESGKAVITDFGLVHVAKRLCERYYRPSAINRQPNHSNCMSIPQGWLCYLAPEIMQLLRVQPDETDDDLPFSKSSDVYAFGTVWYEMLTGEWPWKRHPPEAIIWLVGRGMKPSLANLQYSRDVKDVLVLCWIFNAAARPDFESLSNSLQKIPKKRLARSPSHPVQLSRSVESVF